MEKTEATVLTASPIIRAQYDLVVIILPSVKCRRFKKKKNPTYTKHPFLFHATQTLVTRDPGMALDACALWNGGACVRALRAHPPTAYFAGCTPWCSQSSEASAARRRFRNSHEFTRLNTNRAAGEMEELSWRSDFGFGSV